MLGRQSLPVGSLCLVQFPGFYAAKRKGEQGICVQHPAHAKECGKDVEARASLATGTIGLNASQRRQKTIAWRTKRLNELLWQIALAKVHNRETGLFDLLLHKTDMLFACPGESDGHSAGLGIADSGCDCVPQNREMANASATQAPFAQIRLPLVLWEKIEILAPLLAKACACYRIGEGKYRRNCAVLFLQCLTEFLSHSFLFLRNEFHAVYRFEHYVVLR